MNTLVHLGVLHGVGNAGDGLVVSDEVIGGEGIDESNLVAIF